MKKAKHENLLSALESEDGIDRAGFIKCMAWAGTGVLWMMSGGVLKSFGMSQLVDRHTGQLKPGLVLPAADFSFVQISDSHIGFNKPANPDVVGTLQATIDKINAMSNSPSFVLHTGDLSHLSQKEEFDTLDQALKSVKTDRIFYVPGEHDVLNDNGKSFLERYGKGTKGQGWYSFDKGGVHFVGLNNVVDTSEGGLGSIGPDQLAWLADDLKGLSNSTPREYHLSHSHLYRLPAAAAGDGPRTRPHEGSRRKTSHPPRTHQRQLRRTRPLPGDHRYSFNRPALNQ